MSAIQFAVRNGWRIGFYGPFADAYRKLCADVEAVRENSPDTWRSHPKAKLLKRLNAILFDEVPADPAHANYRLGTTLGRYKDWQRVKFLGRYRLFFRFHSPSKTIIYAWLSNEDSLRKEGARTDPYAVFQGLLASGKPPSDWDELLRAVTADPET